MQNIETITKNLVEGYSLLEKGTFHEASQVQIKRRTDKSLRNRWFYTANLPLFRMNGRVLEYGLSGSKTFDAIAGADIQDFSRQILNNGVYTLNSSQTKQLEELADDIVWAKASDLKLKKHNNDKEGYFLIDTSDTNAKVLDDAQRAFATKVHGSLNKYNKKQGTHDYGETMNMFRNEGNISETKIWLPNQKHIKSYIKKGKIVAWTSKLYYFGNDSSFSAGLRLVDFHLGLCGVPKIAEADTTILVSLQEDVLHKTLSQYLDPIVLDTVKQELAEKYL